MGHVSDYFAGLVSKCADRETDYQLAMRFAQEGGEHRFQINIEHPDPEVKACMERLAKQHLQGRTLVRILQKAAHNDFEAAQREMIERVSAFRSGPREVAS